MTLFVSVYAAIGIVVLMLAVWARNWAVRRRGDDGKSLSVTDYVVFVAIWPVMLFVFPIMVFRSFVRTLRQG